MMSCNTTEPKEEQKEITSQINVISEADTSIQTPGASSNYPPPTEYIEWSSIKINNVLPLNTNAEQVKGFLGMADSTTTPDYDNICYNCHFCNEKIPPFKYVYFKGIEFEQLNDSLEFWSADFTLNKSLFLQSGNMRFDHRTTLEEVSRIFPKAVKAKQVEEAYIMVSISPSEQLVDGSFILEFNRSGYLTMFYYWFPC
ncbi:hypothetical protein DC20_15190 [Rufibacter tibetensis]|uniref:Uncharacterized protein n=1 Tax=Rufibacter tibetensis TaxID=512763 RepID=A0A0P0CKI2_9BACT|nr:hypothetical protein DC20_15190 [Rufibacter tibetensis]